MVQNFVFTLSLALQFRVSELTNYPLNVLHLDVSDLDFSHPGVSHPETSHPNVSKLQVSERDIWHLRHFAPGRFAREPLAPDVGPACFAPGRFEPEIFAAGALQARIFRTRLVVSIDS